MSDFPKEIKIKSPELEAVRDSTKTIANLVTKHMQEIIQAIQVLPELPKLLKRLNKTVTKNFTNLFTSSVEAEILNRQAIIKVTESKTDFINNHIERKKNHTNNAIEVIRKDFKGYFDEVAQDQETFIRQLDSHVHELLEDVYPKQIDAKYQFHATPCLLFLTQQISDSAYTRTQCITASLNRAEAEVVRFVDERNDAYSKLNPYTIENIDPGDYELPCWFIETEDIISGEINTKVIIPDSEESISSLFSRESLESIINSINHHSVNCQNKPDKLNALIEELQDRSIIPDKEVIRFKQDCHSMLIEE